MSSHDHITFRGPNAKRAKVEVEVEVKVPAVAPEVAPEVEEAEVAVAPDVAVAVPKTTRSNERILDQVLRGLSSAMNIADVDTGPLPGQRGLYFLDAAEDVALVFYSLAERCGDGTDAQRCVNLTAFVLTEARKAMPAARAPSVTITITRAR